MKRIKSIKRAYVFEKVTSNKIIKLLGLFHVKNIFMEIINIEKDTDFYRNIQGRKDEYMLLSDSASKMYADVFISECFSENFIARGLFML